MSSPLFRKTALEKLSTPEQLDQLVRVTTPKSWLALVAIGAAIVAAAVWGFYGRIPTKVQGNGVIIHRGGTFNVVATSAGRVVELDVPEDRVVAPGQVIAKVAQPDLAARVIAAQGELDDLVAERALERDADRQQRADLAINAARRRLEALQSQLADAETVVSPTGGHVLALEVAVGDVVSAGTVLCNLELGENDLVATVYVSPADGKKVAVGSAVQLSPADVKREEYGYLLGRVASVSKFPVSQGEMMYLLQNDSLVKLFSSHGAPFSIDVELVPDPSTASGFAWSSTKSPPVSITSGTVCTAAVVVGERRPIDMVIPYLRERLGV